jgi:tRNA pseudouridine38-40 synthase
MIEAAGLVVGEHDFTSFAAVDPERMGRIMEDDNQLADNPITNVRTIFSSTWMRDGEEFVYNVRGNGFLHHMVRNLVGTFLLLGKGTLRQDDLRRIIELRIRASAGPTAPASGLFLANVEY